MTPEVRRAALIIAAKATLFASLGCSGGLPPTTSSAAATTPTTPAPSPATAPAPPAAPATTCAAHLDALATATPAELPANDPLRERGGVYGAFTDIAARTSERTRQCCDEELRRDGSSAAHRWGCCSALPDADDLMIACTPWGPPCPPSLRV